MPIGLVLPRVYKESLFALLFSSFPTQLRRIAQSTEMNTQEFHSGGYTVKVRAHFLLLCHFLPAAHGMRRRLTGMDIAQEVLTEEECTTILIINFVR